MTTCTRARDLFSVYLEGDLEPERSLWLEAHLEGCSECRDLFGDFEDLVTTCGAAAGMNPPDHLGDEISSSPCRRWLGLLFAAVDREISETNLDRLFQHLESCEGCRRAWADLSLIHQISDNIEPPQHLLARCIRPRRRPTTRTILGRRTATAAAYALAILASLVVGNPVSLARHDAAETVQKVSAAVESADLGGVARSSRGEARVMLWRALNMGRRAADAVNSTWDRLTGSRDDSGPSAQQETSAPEDRSDNPGPDATRKSATRPSTMTTTTTDRKFTLAPSAGVADKEHRS